MSVRRICALLQYLPSEGVFVAEAVGNGIPWNMQTEMLATMVEQTDALTRIVLRVWGGVKELPKPVHVARPWDNKEPEKPKISSVTEIKAFMKRGAKRRRG